MSYIRPPLVTGEMYHLYNRGVAKGILYQNSRDYEHFLEILSFFRDADPPEKISRIAPKTLARELAEEPKHPLVQILAFCLMPNHFHLLVQQLQDGGISTFMRRSLDSYTRYFNTKNDRVGTMYQGKFQAVHVETDQQLLHLSRYIHLNPYVAQLIQDPAAYRWSSLLNYERGEISRLCDPSFILEMAGSPKQYMDFVQDQAEYARSYHKIKKLILE